MDDVARRLLEEMQVRAQAAGVELAVNVIEGAPTVVRGDPTRLAQVLQNLVDNALKFTPKGGHVRVSFAEAEGAPSGRLQIDVVDDGCGVPAEAIPRLFEPFFQVPSAAHAGEGSGLGLAIVKAVVEAHRGEIRVTSEEAKGTTFSLLFPAEVRSREDAPGTTSPPSRTAAE